MIQVDVVLLESIVVIRGYHSCDWHCRSARLLIRSQVCTRRGNRVGRFRLAPSGETWINNTYSWRTHIYNCRMVGCGFTGSTSAPVCLSRCLHRTVTGDQPCTRASACHEFEGRIGPSRPRQRPVCSVCDLPPNLAHLPHAPPAFLQHAGLRPCAGSRPSHVVWFSPL